MTVIKVDLLAGFKPDGTIDWLSLSYDSRNCTKEIAMQIVKEATKMPAKESLMYPSETKPEPEPKPVTRRSMFP